ncbi:LmeA family phospholipid-binding protein [Tsukamurella paurometabola]|nr:LmeA family phospholipid-binding protein [Tsukamurella paurometabola]
MDTNPNDPQRPEPQIPDNSGPFQPGQQPAPGGWERPQQPPRQPQQPGPERIGGPQPEQPGRHAQPQPGSDQTVPLPASPQQVPPQQTVPMSAATPPAGPGGPGGPGNPGPMNVGPSQPPAQRSEKSKSKIIGLTAAGLVAALVIILVGSELYFRNSVSSCLEDNVKNGTKANNVSVSFSKTPMVLQQLSGKIPSINIDAQGLNATDGLNANILLKGVDPGGDNRVDEAVIQGTFTADGIKNKVSQTGVLTNPTVNLNTSASQIEITGTALIVPITVNLKPTLKDNKVVLTASKASILGVGVPDDLAQQLISAIADIPTPQGLTASDLKMTDQGVSVTYTGKNVLPKDIESSGDMGSVSCSVI